MEKLGHGRLIAGLAALALVIGATWIALEYFVPSLPFKLTIATGRKEPRSNILEKDIEQNSHKRE